MLFFKQWPVSYNTPYEKIGDEVRSLADEVPFDIPDSWEWVRLIDVCEYIQRGKSPKYSPIKKYPVVAQKCNQWSGFSIEKAQFIEPNSLSSYGPERLLQDNDLMWNSTGLGTLGRMAIYKTTANPYELAVADSHVTVIRPLKQFVLPEYLYYYFANPSVQSVIEDQADGTTKQKELATATIKAYLTPIPPLDEQRRILAKLSEVLPVVKNYGVVYDETTAMQEAFPESLKKSILQEAVQGKLVPQDPSDEPAEALLERIRAEKRRLIKEGKIKKDKHESVIFRRDNSHYEKLDGVERCIDDELPFEIPDSWVWVRLGTVLEIARGGSPRPIQQYLTTEPDGINWIKIGDTDKGGKYIYKTKEKIRPEGVTKSRMVHSGDFLLTNSMSFGRPYILKTDGCIHDGWLVLSNRFDCYSVDFIYYILSSPFAYYQFCDSVSGAVVKNLNSDKVANALFPLPPLAEQHRIVQRIEELLPLVKGL
ncbi:restriction endonuclease subunit S [Lawsonibacter sp. DFI.6.74]|nr:restriction endonuclease subunit S [Lawsonibacter sp. DFI.6.74]MCG4772133.1 restriction endonuclease subunit S [Lawsonibacter sp. DFI.5.51]